MNNQLKPIVEVRNLSKIYDGDNGKALIAVNGISFQIYPGEILALLGPNGAGKTTLASMLVTLMPPTTGDILFKGSSIYDDVYQYRRYIGYCPQKPNLYPALTIEQNLIYSGRLYGLDEPTIQKQFRQLVQRYALEPYLDKTIQALSGGYRQRVSIARALIHQPQIILFDEPTVGLDPHIRRKLWDEVLELKKAGITILLTTHYLDEAEYLADRVCVMEKGKIKLIDTPDNLKKMHNTNTLEELFLELFQE